MRIEEFVRDIVMFSLLIEVHISAFECLQRKKKGSLKRFSCMCIWVISYSSIHNEYLKVNTLL